MFFNSEEDKLIEISKDGLFNIWVVKDYKLVFTFLFREDTVDMLYHFGNNLVFIAFRKELRLFCLDKDDLVDSFKDANLQPETFKDTHQGRNLKDGYKSGNLKDGHGSNLKDGHGSNLKDGHLQGSNNKDGQGSNKQSAFRLRELP